MVAASSICTPVGGLVTHGSYQITIDAWVYNPVSGNVSDGDGLFQTSLFTTSSLKVGYHTVWMTNVGQGALDLDYLTWQTPIGQPEEELITQTIQDNESSFRYSPEGAWNVTFPNQGMFAGGSGHQTTTAGATAELAFEMVDIESFLTGDTVFLYGSVGPNGASYSVQMDDQAPLNFTSLKSPYRPGTMLYQASNLGGGRHTVKVVSTSYSNSGRTLSIDYAEVYTVPSLQLSTGSPRLTTGAIIGISIGGFFGLTLLLGLLFYLFKWRWKSQQYKRISQRPSSTVYDPYTYVPPTATADPSNLVSPSASSQKSRILYSQSSHSSFGMTSPMSAACSGSTMEPFSPEPCDPIDNAQLVTVTYPRDSKCNPQITLAPAPVGTAGIRASSSHSSLAQLPPGARIPTPPGSQAINHPPSYGGSSVLQ
ncbi:hypothetical protein CVT24_007053 [Panaeolus cyanescens]|uniref:Uncharacterized protein n=1 Tax=Panaeolus cyanescens TaxID=181874 RepID=A0A409VJL9_9AGAR|nr:hypothetical protein CVT24_007053 [Panaeolus cyanescens]